MRISPKSVTIVIYSRPKKQIADLLYAYIETFYAAPANAYEAPLTISHSGHAIDTLDIRFIYRILWAIEVLKALSIFAGPIFFKAAERIWLKFMIYFTAYWQLSGKNYYHFHHFADFNKRVTDL